jgi:phage gpG-like protein
MAGVRGDFTRLHTLISGMRQFNARMMKQANTQLAEEALNQVQYSFAHGVDPYGTKWEPLQHRAGQPLRKSGRLMNSQNRRVTTQGFIVETNVIYAAVHQYGATINRRQMRFNGRFVSGKKAQAAADKRSAALQAGKRVRKSTGYAASRFDIIIPARSWLPGTRGLGPRWTKAFTSVLLQLRRKRLGR